MVFTFGDLERLLKGIPIVPLVLATLLSGHGLRRRSLSHDGAAAAFMVGFVMMAAGVWVFGVSLIVFYLVGSRATKYGKGRKAELEDGYHEGGNRSGWQVLCNSFAAFVATVMWTVMFVPGSVQVGMMKWLGGLVGMDVDVGLDGLVGSARDVYGDGSGWCPADREIGGGWSRVLVFATLGHFGCCLGDTLASELGILSSSPPVLVTTFKRVPPGTNGAISVGGTLASMVGGLIMGATVGVCLVLENRVCREGWTGVVGSAVLWGGFAGLFGSFIDSVMGATIQKTRFSVDSKRVLQDGSTSRGEVKVISGLDVLSNNQVNLISSAVCAVLVGHVG